MMRFFSNFFLPVFLTISSWGKTWHKGNTHVHTKLCGHADSTPQAVASWYLDHGYHFVILAEHNQFIDPASVKLPEDRRTL